MVYYCDERTVLSDTNLRYVPISAPVAQKPRGGADLGLAATEARKEETMNRTPHDSAADGTTERGRLHWGEPKTVPFRAKMCQT